MLSTDSISGAFTAIREIAEDLKSKGISENKDKKLSTIISIAKHQSDIRTSAKKGKGCCKAKSICKAKSKGKSKDNK